MSKIIVLNASVRSTGVLLESGIRVLLGKATSMVVGSLAKVFETVDLTSKWGECSVGSSSATTGVDMVFFLEIMAD